MAEYVDLLRKLEVIANIDKKRVPCNKGTMFSVRYEQNI